MLYGFKLDGKEAILDNANEQVFVYAAERGRDGRAVVDTNCIPRAERFIAYGAACLHVANSLVGLAGDVHEVGDMGDAFYERAFEDLESRWLDYVEECHRQWSGESVPEADRVPAMTRGECEEALEAMRMRMSVFCVL